MSHFESNSEGSFSIERVFEHSLNAGDYQTLKKLLDLNPSFPVSENLQIFLKKHNPEWKDLADTLSFLISNTPEVINTSLGKDLMNKAVIQGDINFIQTLHFNNPKLVEDQKVSAILESPEKQNEEIFIYFFKKAFDKADYGFMVEMLTHNSFLAKEEISFKILKSTINTGQKKLAMLLIDQNPKLLDGEGLDEILFKITNNKNTDLVRKVLEKKPSLANPNLFHPLIQDFYSEDNHGLLASIVEATPDGAKTLYASICFKKSLKENNLKTIEVLLEKNPFLIEYVQGRNDFEKLLHKNIPFTKLYESAFQSIENITKIKENEKSSRILKDEIFKVVEIGRAHV